MYIVTHGNCKSYILSKSKYIDILPNTLLKVRYENMFGGYIVGDGEQVIFMDSASQPEPNITILERGIGETIEDKVFGLGRYKHLASIPVYLLSIITGLISFLQVYWLVGYVLLAFGYPLETEGSYAIFYSSIGFILKEPWFILLNTLLLISSSMVVNRLEVIMGRGELGIKNLPSGIEHIGYGTFNLWENPKASTSTINSLSKTLDNHEYNEYNLSYINLNTVKNFVHDEYYSYLIYSADRVKKEQIFNLVGDGQIRLLDVICKGYIRFMQRVLPYRG